MRISDGSSDGCSSDRAASLEEWRARLETFTGQWAVVQNSIEAAVDPQTVANGYMQELETASGTSFRLVAAPVQYDEQPAQPGRAPEFNEHGDEVLSEIGIALDSNNNPPIRGVVSRAAPHPAPDLLPIGST